jgi:hypothetical protein
MNISYNNTECPIRDGLEKDSFVALTDSER